MRGAAVAIHINDPILRYSITLSRISSALQFLCDNVYLFSRLGLLRLDQGNLLSVSSKLWLYADLLNIIRVCYEIRHEIKEQIDRQESNIRNSKHSFYSTCKCVMVRRPDLVMDLVKNVSDVWLPVHASGLTQLSPGSVGLFGTVSSVLGAATIWQKSGKLWVCSWGSNHLAEKWRVLSSCFFKMNTWWIDTMDLSYSVTCFDFFILIENVNFAICIDFITG